MPALKSSEEESVARIPPDHRLGAGSGAGAPASGLGSALRKIGLLVILLAAAALGYWKYKGNKQTEADTAAKTVQQANRAIPVTAATVTARTMPIFLTALGTATAYNTVTVKSRVDGQLLSVNVREGQQVRKGQLLAQIDPRPYDATVAQAVGQLAKDQAAADNSKAEAGRYTALYNAGVVSKESEQTQISSAGQSQGTLQADRAAIQAAKVNVAYTHITSPINGVVGLRQVDAGNIVHASDANGLLVVTQLQPIAVIFTMPEDQLPAVLKLIRGGRKLVAEAYDRSETTKLATGSLLTLDNEIDTTTGTVKAKAIFDNRDGALFPNQFVNVRLILEQRQNAVVMPGSALQSGTNGSFVYLLKKGNPPKPANEEDGPGGAGGGANVAAGAAGGGRGAAGSGAAGSGGAGSGGAGEAPAGPPRDPYYVVVQPVVVDLTEGTQIILKSGLRPGDQVIVDGQEKLKPNSKVDPRPVGGRGGAGGGTGRGGAAAGGIGASADASSTGGPAAADTSVGAGASPDTGEGSLSEPGQRGRHGTGPAAAAGATAPGQHGGQRRPQEEQGPQGKRGAQGPQGNNP